MKKLNTYRIILIAIFLSIGCVSCETTTTNEHGSMEEVNTSLNINFHDNILELHPLLASNPSEEFIAELVFERIFHDDGTSSIIQDYQFDSLNNLYVFNLIPNQSFHDGSSINTTSVKEMLRRIFKNHSQVPEVDSLLTSLDGFQLINWYRQNRNILDSIPRGFKAINDLSFSIRLTKNNDKLLNWMKDSHFTLFKKEGGDYIGSGVFKLEHLHEDLSAILTRHEKVEQGIKTINLSFTKNSDLAYSDFFNEQLDLITYMPQERPGSSTTNYLDSIISKKYSPFQVQPTSQSLIRYAKIHNVPDSILLNSLLLALKSEPKYSTIPKMLASKNRTDSLNLLTPISSISILNAQSFDYQVYFNSSDSLEFIVTTLENINPSEPHIVLKETTIDNWNPNNIKASKFSILNTVKKEENAKYIIFDVISEYVIYNNTLRGVDEYNSLSAMVKNAYFKKPKVY